MGRGNLAQPSYEQVVPRDFDFSSCDCNGHLYEPYRDACLLGCILAADNDCGACNDVYPHGSLEQSICLGSCKRHRQNPPTHVPDPGGPSQVPEVPDLPTPEDPNPDIATQSCWEMCDRRYERDMDICRNILIGYQSCLDANGDEFICGFILAEYNQCVSDAGLGFIDCLVDNCYSG